MSLSAIDFSKASQPIPYIVEPGAYVVQISDAKIIPSEHGQVLQVFFKTKEGNMHIHRYSFQHSVESISGMNIKHIADLLDATGLPKGSSESDLVGKILNITLEVDKKSDKYLRLVKVSKYTPGF